MVIENGEKNYQATLMGCGLLLSSINKKINFFSVEIDLAKSHFIIILKIIFLFLHQNYQLLNVSKFKTQNKL